MPDFLMQQAYLCIASLASSGTVLSVAGGVPAAEMLISATSSNAILGGQQLAQAQDVSSPETMHQYYNIACCLTGLTIHAAAQPYTDLEHMYSLI